MPEIKERLQKAGINIIMSYIEKDPEKNLEKLLDGFFKRQKAEVLGMSLTEFDEEEFKRVCYEDGVYDKAVEATANLLKEGISQEMISRCIGLPPEEVQKIAERLSVQA